MKKYFYLCMIATSLLSISACDFDDDTAESKDSDSESKPVATSIGIKNVFEEGLPKQFSMYKSVDVDANGRVTKIESDYETAIFDYSDATRAGQEYDVKISIMEDSCVYKELYCKVNKSGFVYDVQMCYYGECEYTWAIEYDNDNHLAKVSRTSVSANVTFDITNIYYQNGDIVKVTREDPDKHRDECIIKYTDANHSTPIANKACIMLFDTSFSIDLDEMEYAYVAGLLGKATTHLPLAQERIFSENESAMYYFSWTLNNANMPTMLEYSDSEGYQIGEYTWTW